MATLEATTLPLDSGERSRRYPREPETLRQLAHFDGLTSGAVIDALFGQPASERLSEEVLVTLLRRCAAQYDDDSAWRITGEITNRVKGRIARTLKLWRLDKPESTAEDAIDEIITTLYHALFDQTGREQFWEVRFWVAFDRKVLKIVQRLRADLDKRDSAHFDVEEAAPISSDGTQFRAYLDANLRDPVTGVLVGEALALLSSRERTAFVLKHVARMPEDSASVNDPLTIARVLNVSPRTVRNYLTRAEKILSTWRQSSVLTSSASS